MSEQASVSTNETPVSTDAAAAATVSEPLVSLAGAVRVLLGEQDRVEIRYYDDTDRFRHWIMTAGQARDLVQWWEQEGRQLAQGGTRLPERRRGGILVSILSRTQVFVRVCDAQGRTNITGYQLPREAVETLAADFASRSKNSP